MSQTPLTDATIILDFEERQEAERLILEAQDEDRLRELIYELIELRADYELLVGALRESLAEECGTHGRECVSPSQCRGDSQ